MRPDPPTDPVERLAWEVTRVVDRLRTLPLARLARPCGDAPSAAAAAYHLAQALADAAADLAGEPRRRLPRLGDSVVGDQVAVTGHDLLAAAAGPIRASADVSAVLVEATAQVRDLRLAL